MKIKITIRNLFAFIIFLMAENAFAEYRVYQYYVRPKVVIDPRENASYLVTSTLDPVTYVSYHGGNDSIQADSLRTWMCHGHTGNGITPCQEPVAVVIPTPAP